MATVHGYRYFKITLCLIFLLMVLPQTASADEKLCRYKTWEWNTITKRSENHKTVNKPYSKLTPEEKDPLSSCTVCETDQSWVRVEGAPPIRICKHFSAKVESALRKIVESGFPIRTLSAYRVGRSKGKISPRGLRTQFSHHSFGTAIDLNAEQNGLFTNCFTFGPNCRLLRGGPWVPGNPGTIIQDSVVFESFKEIGWQWGGLLEGKQKDFMHFSLSGD